MSHKILEDTEWLDFSFKSCSQKETFRAGNQLQWKKSGLPFFSSLCFKLQTKHLQFMSTAALGRKLLWWWGFGWLGWKKSASTLTRDRREKYLVKKQKLLKSVLVICLRFTSKWGTLYIPPPNTIQTCLSSAWLGIFQWNPIIFGNSSTYFYTNAIYFKHRRNEKTEIIFEFHRDLEI